MFTITQCQTNTNSLKEQKPLLPCIKQNIPLFESIVNKFCDDIIKEPEQKKELKFLTKKRGRKNKFMDITELDNEKNVHGRLSDDNIKRRIKGLYNNYIILLLNKLIKKRFKKYKLKFVKMNIRLTKDIGIEYNKNLLEKKIKDIIINVSNKYNNKENNKNCIKYIQSQNDTEEIMNILNMTYKDLYINYYLKSKEEEYSYESNKEILFDKYGKEYLDKFIQNAEHFIEFFYSGKNRKTRKQKEIEEIDIPIENTESISTNDISDNDNKNKKMDSTCTQTDICGINIKLIAFG